MEDWKLIVPEKAPGFVMVIDLTKKKNLFVGENRGSDLMTAKKIAATPKLIQALARLLHTLTIDDQRDLPELIKEGREALKAATA